MQEKHCRSGTRSDWHTPRQQALLNVTPRYRIPVTHCDAGCHHHARAFFSHAMHCRARVRRAGHCPRGLVPEFLADRPLWAACTGSGITRSVRPSKSSGLVRGTCSGWGGACCGVLSAPQERGRAADSLPAAQPIVLCALANRTNGPDPPDCVTALDTGRISSAPMQIGPLQLLVIPSISIGIAMRCAPRTASRQTRCWRDAVMFAAKRDGCGYAFHNVAP